MVEKLASEEKENGQTVKLKALLRQQPENEVTVDQLDKYDKANPLDIAVLNYLGQNISEAGMERLNNGEDWKSVVITEYMLDIAKQSGNKKLKENIESLLHNPELKPEEIGIYALKALEKSYSRKEIKKLKKKLKKSKKQEEPLDSKVDIYIIPQGKDSFEPKVCLELGNSDKFDVNFYAPCEFNKEITEFGLMKAISDIEYKKVSEATQVHMGFDAWFAIIFCGLLGIIPGIFAYRLTKEECERYEKKAEAWGSLQSCVKALKPEDANWHVHDDLKDVYDFAYNGEKLSMECKDEKIKKMFNCSSNMDERLKYAIRVKRGDQETIMIGGYGK